MNNDVIKEDKLNYVLVEGPDDAQVFYHLLRYYGLDTHITIHQKAGIDTLAPHAQQLIEWIRRLFDLKSA